MAADQEAQPDTIGGKQKRQGEQEIELQQVAQLGRVPQVNDKVVIDHLEFTVVEADARRAKQVLVKPLTPKEATGGEPSQG